MKELNLKGLFKYYWRKKIVFIIGLIIGIVGSLIYVFFFQSPKYTTTASVTLSRNAANQTTQYLNREEALMNTELIYTYNEMIKQERILSKVIETTGSDYSIKDISEMISTEILDKSLIISISVETEDQTEGVTILNSLIEELKKEVTETYGLDNIKIVSEPKIPMESSNLSKKIVILLTVFVVMAILCVLLFTIYYLM